MPLALLSDEEKIILLESPEFDPTQSGFRLEASDNNDDVVVNYVHPYQLNVPYDDYFVFALTCQTYSENDIFEVYECAPDQRVGLIFPLQALVSREHKKVEEVSFLRFAQGAFMHLCRGNLECHLKMPFRGMQNEYLITDFYAQDTIVLIIYSKMLKDSSKFNIDNYLPSLFQQGYFLQTPGIDPSTLFKSNLGNNGAARDARRVYLEPMSPLLSEIQFISNTFRVLLPYERNSLTTFFYLYQLIELLMGVILQTSYDEIKRKLVDEGHTSSDIRDILDDLNESLSEKKRLNKLTSSHLSKSPDMTQLRIDCNAFLDHQESNLKTTPGNRNFAEFLYPVRNAVFHNLRSVKPDSQKTLERISESLKPVVCSFLINYQGAS